MGRGLVAFAVLGLAACGGTAGSDDDATDVAEACAQAIEAPQCGAIEACTFSPANAELYLDDAGECASRELPFDDDDAVGMCAEGDEGVLAGPTVGGVYVHLESGRVFVYGLRPEPPLGWDLCTCGSDAAPACQCMDECA